MGQAEGQTGRMVLCVNIRTYVDRLIVWLIANCVSHRLGVQKSTRLVSKVNEIGVQSQRDWQVMSLGLAVNLYVFGKVPGNKVGGVLLEMRKNKLQQD